MKRIVFLFAMAGFFLQLQSQILFEKDVPLAVSNAFFKTYPFVLEVDWSKDGYYIVAEYDSGRVVNSATYTVTGILVNNRMEILAIALPALLNEYMLKNYMEAKLQQTCKVTDAFGIVTYEGKIQGMDLTFDSKGNFIKSVKD